MSDREYLSDSMLQDDFGDESFESNLDLDMDVDVDDNGLETGIADHSTVVSSADGQPETKAYGSMSDFLAASQSAATAKNNPRERSNAKPVEVYDLDGNFLKIYASGTLAARDMNIQQSDISLCCRGMKDSVGEYRFRFSSNLPSSSAGPQGLKPKRGFAYVPVLDAEADAATTGGANPKAEVHQRKTRASRGEYGLHMAAIIAAETASKQLQQKQLSLPPPEIKARGWTHQTVAAGPFLVRKWLPVRPHATAELQAWKPQTEKKRKSGGRKSLNYSH